MKSHAAIDDRSLAMARSIVDKIDDDPTRAGLDRARGICARWQQRRPSKQAREWQEILTEPWQQVRQILTDESEAGCRLRQNSPFCGFIEPARATRNYRQDS
jgi:hypothetical protein